MKRAPECGVPYGLIRNSRGKLVWLARGTTFLAGFAILATCNNSTVQPAADDHQSASDAVIGQSPWFAEESSTLGLIFVHETGHIDRYLLPEIVGGGGAVFDMENDGDLDVYFVQSGFLNGSNTSELRNLLYRNEGNGRFTDVTSTAGVGDMGYGMGVACGDYDNDGWTDLYVTNVGSNTMFRNNGDGTFTDTTASTGTGHPGWGTSAAFVDFDRDGDLDLYFANYLDWSIETELECFDSLGRLDYCAPDNYKAPAVDTLYRNDGGGRFTDVTESAGLTSYYGPGFGVACADFSDDGLVDVLVANDGQRDQLWINRGDGRFLDEAMLRGCAYDLDGVAKAGMGVAVADVDDDGDTDLLVCNIEGESDSYFLNENGFFLDNTALSGLGIESRSSTRWGMGLIDLNNDSRIDLFQANGAVERLESPAIDDPYAEENLLLQGDGQGNFSLTGTRGGTAEPLIATSRAAVFGDLDNDGGIDIIIVNRGGSTHVLRNQVASSRNWVGIRVLDEHGRDALNAVVTGTVGGRRLMREVRAAYSYLASNDPRVHFGLGSSHAIQDLSIRWLDGTVEHVGDLQSGRYYTVRKGRGADSANGEAGRAPAGN